MGFRDENAALSHKVALLEDRILELEARGEPSSSDATPSPAVRSPAAGELELDAELDEAGVGYLVEELRRATGALGELERIGPSVAWRAPGWTASIVPHRGQTRIRVQRPRRPAWTANSGFAVACVSWAFFIGKPAVIALGAPVFALFAVMIIASRWRARRRRDGVLDRLAEAARHASVRPSAPPVRARVAPVLSAHVAEPDSVLIPLTKGNERCA